VLLKLLSSFIHIHIFTGYNSIVVNSCINFTLMLSFCFRSQDKRSYKDKDRIICRFSKLLKNPKEGRLVDSLSM